jgi:hypothetical protein
MRHALLLLLLVLGGCAPTPSTVTGTLRVEGKPLDNVQVLFMPDADAGNTQPQAAGLTDDQGRFTLSLPNGQPGCRPGQYRVVLIDFASSIAAGNEDARKRGTTPAAPVAVKPRLSAEYSTELRTPLRKTVGTGPQTINLDL